MQIFTKVRAADNANGGCVVQGLCWPLKQVDSSCDKDDQCVKNAQCLSQPSGVCTCMDGYYNQSGNCYKSVIPGHGCTGRLLFSFNSVFCFIIIMWYARKQEHSRDAFLNNQQPVSFKKADINNELNGLLPGKFHIKTQFYIL